jgi:hypothetical protein
VPDSNRRVSSTLAQQAKVLHRPTKSSNAQRLPDLNNLAERHLDFQHYREAAAKPFERSEVAHAPDAFTGVVMQLRHENQPGAGKPSTAIGTSPAARAPSIDGQRERLKHP